MGLSAAELRKFHPLGSLFKADVAVGERVIQAIMGPGRGWTSFSERQV